MKIRNLAASTGLSANSLIVTSPTGSDQLQRLTIADLTSFLISVPGSHVAGGISFLKPATLYPRDANTLPFGPTTGTTTTPVFKADPTNAVDFDRLVNGSVTFTNNWQLGSVPTRIFRSELFSENPVRPVIGDRLLPIVPLMTSYEGDVDITFDTGALGSRNFIIMWSTVMHTNIVQNGVSIPDIGSNRVIIEPILGTGSVESFSLSLNRFSGSTFAQRELPITTGIRFELGFIKVAGSAAKTTAETIKSALVAANGDMTAVYNSRTSNPQLESAFLNVRSTGLQSAVTFSFSDTKVTMLQNTQAGRSVDEVNIDSSLTGVAGQGSASRVPSSRAVNNALANVSGGGGGLSTVATDSSLSGTGAAASPLSVALQRTSVALDLPDPANVPIGSIVTVIDSISNVNFHGTTYNFPQGTIFEKFGALATGHWSDTGLSARNYFRGEWRNVGGYRTGDMVTYLNEYWRVISDVGSNVAPGSSASWKRLSGIDNSAVTTDKLADSAVTSTKIAADSVGDTAIDTTNTGVAGQVLSLEQPGRGFTWITPASGGGTPGTGSVGTNELANNAVTADKLASNSVTSDKLVTDSVGDIAISTTNTGSSGQVLSLNSPGGNFTWVNQASGGGGTPGAGSIGTTQLANNAVTTAKIADNAVSQAKIPSSAINSSKLASNAVTTDKVADSNITNSKLADSSVSTTKIADDAVISSKIADAAVGTSQIADDAVNSAKLANSAVVADSISTGAVTSTKIAAGNVTTTTVADNAITAAKLASNSVSTSELVNGSVTNAKLGSLSIATGNIQNNAVTGNKIALSGVDTLQLANDSVTSAKIAAGAVATSELGTSVITADKLSNNSVTSTKIADNAITRAKVADDAVGAAELQTASAGTAGQVLARGSDNALVWTTAGSGEEIAGSNSSVQTIPVVSGSATSSLGSSPVIATIVVNEVANQPVTIAVSFQVRNNGVGWIAAGVYNVGDTTVQGSDLFQGVAFNSSSADNGTWPIGGGISYTPTTTATTTRYLRFFGQNTPTVSNNEGGVVVSQLGGGTPNAGSITSLELASGAVGTTQLVDGSVTTPKLADSSVTTAKLASNSVNRTKIVTTNTGTTGQVLSAGAQNALTFIDPPAADGGTPGAGLVGTTQLADNSVTTVKVADSNITNTKIANAAVSSSKIGTGAVTSTKLAASAVDATSIASLAVTDDKIADSTISAGKLASNSVITAKIADDAVTAAKIADNAVTSASITSGAVTTAKLGLGSVNSVNIAAGAIDSNRLGSSSVTSGKIADNAVITAKIQDDAITTDKIAAGAVDATELADTSIILSKIDASNTATANQVLSASSDLRNFTWVNQASGGGGTPGAGSVGTTQLADGAVTNAKIATNAVESFQIQNNAVISAKIADNAVTSSKIASGSVTTSELAVNSVSNSQLIDNSVTKAKLVTTNAGTLGQVLSSGILGSLTFIDPPSANGGTPGAGLVGTTQLADDSVTSAKLATGAVDSSALAASSVTNSALVDSSVTSNKLSGGSVTEAILGNASVTSAKLANAAVSAAKIQANSVTKEKLADDAVGIAELDTTNAGSNGQILSRASATQGTWIDASSGGGATLATNAQFSTGTSTTLAPTVNQTVQAIAASQPMLALWNGRTDPETAVQDGPLPTKVGTGAYDAVNDRFVIDSATTTPTNLRWQNENINWRQTAFCFDLDQNKANWGLIAYFGTPSNEITTGGNAGDAGTGFGLNVHYDTHSASQNRVRLYLTLLGPTNVTAFLQPVSRSNGAGGTGDAILLDTNPRKNIMFVRNHHDIRIFADRLLIATYRLTDAQNDAPLGPRYGFVGNGVNVSTKEIYLYGVAIGNPDLALLDENCSPQSTLAAGAVTTASLANSSVTDAKLASNSVGTIHLAENAVTLSKMGNDSVGAAELQTTNAGTSGQVLSRGTGNSSTWIAAGGGGLDIFSGSVPPTPIPKGYLFERLNRLYVARNALSSYTTTPSNDPTNWLKIGGPPIRVSLLSSPASIPASDSFTLVNLNALITPFDKLVFAFDVVQRLSIYEVYREDFTLTNVQNFLNYTFRFTEAEFYWGGNSGAISTLRVRRVGSTSSTFRLVDVTGIRF